jgi:hypothetical protein
MPSATGDPWEDEGFGGEDDWAAQESLESDLEDEEDGEELDSDHAELENELDSDDDLDAGS